MFEYSKCQHESNRSSEADYVSARPAYRCTSVGEIGRIQPPVLLLCLLSFPPLIVNGAFDISGRGRVLSWELAGLVMGGERSQLFVVGDGSRVVSVLSQVPAIEVSGQTWPFFLVVVPSRDIVVRDGGSSAVNIVLIVMRLRWVLVGLGHDVFLYILMFLLIRGFLRKG